MSRNEPSLARRKDQVVTVSGFTLLEVVVALAVLGLSLTVTMQLISGAFTNIARINQYFVASNHAENIMNELLVSPEVRGPMQSNGVFEDGYQWAATIVEHPEPPDPVPTSQPYVSPLVLLEVQVSVQWQQRSRPHTYTLKSMRIINTSEWNAPGLSTPRLSSQGEPGGSGGRTPGPFQSEAANKERLGPRRGRGGLEAP